MQSKKSNSILIISSGNDHVLTQEELMGLGRVRWMSKPYTIDDLITSID